MRAAGIIRGDGLRSGPLLLVFGVMDACASSCTANPVHGDAASIDLRITHSQSDSAPVRVCRVDLPNKLFERRLRIDAASCVELDAQFAEWPAMIETKVVTEAGPGAEFSTALATDGTMLYVAARLREWVIEDGDKERIRVRLWFSRGSNHGPPLDVWLAIPPDRRGHGVVTLMAQDEATERVIGARMRVEPQSQGFDLEAAIPWDVLAPAIESRLGLRGSIEYDFQGREVSGVVLGFGSPDGVLVPLPIEQLLLSDLDDEARRLWPGATRSWLDAGADFPYTADILGDARLERIGRIGGLVSVCVVDGAAAGGRCQRLNWGQDTRIEGVEAHDALGLGKDALIVRYWTPTSTADHLVLEVLAPADNDELRPVFRHEIAVYMHCCGSEADAPPHVRSEVRVGSGVVEVRAERAWRVTESRFDEPPLGNGILPVVAPWDKPPCRRFVARDGQLIRDSQTRDCQLK